MTFAEQAAMAMCEGQGYYQQRPCVLCGCLTFGRACTPTICAPCREPHHRLAAHAIHKVHKAIAKGELPRASTLTCVDCGKPAAFYDHRDYTKPLMVAPVCRSCNAKRGVAEYPKKAA